MLTKAEMRKLIEPWKDAIDNHEEAFPEELLRHLTESEIERMAIMVEGAVPVVRALEYVLDCR